MLSQLVRSKNRFLIKRGLVMLRKIRQVLLVGIAVLGTATAALAYTITISPPSSSDGYLIVQHKTYFRGEGACLVSQSLVVRNGTMRPHAHTENCRSPGLTMLLQKKQSRWSSFGTVGVWRGNNSIWGSRKCYKSNANNQWRQTTRIKSSGRTSAYLPTNSVYARCN